MKKGFTLIELLAVIVILAIIALIAVPIILNIIDDARKQSDKRSIEMYGDAVKNAVADYSLKNPSDDEVTFEDIEEDYIEYDGSKVECSTHEIYSDGTIWLKDCTVNDKPVEYEYGKYKQVYKPDFYWYGTTQTNKVGDLFSEEKSETPPAGHDFYIGIDVDDSNKVTSAYACFNRNGNVYCIKGADPTAYDTNVSIMKDAFKDVVDSSCYIYDHLPFGSDFNCGDDSVAVKADTSGGLIEGHVEGGCVVNTDGVFYCH